MNRLVVDHYRTLEIKHEFPNNLPRYELKFTAELSIASVDRRSRRKRSYNDAFQSWLASSLTTYFFYSALTERYYAAIKAFARAHDITVPAARDRCVGRIRVHPVTKKIKVTEPHPGYRSEHKEDYSEEELKSLNLIFPDTKDYKGDPLE